MRREHPDHRRVASSDRAGAAGPGGDRPGADAHPGLPRADLVRAGRRRRRGPATPHGRTPLPPGAIVVAFGGARGITPELLDAVARTTDRPHLYVIGRTPLPETDGELPPQAEFIAAGRREHPDASVRELKTAYERAQARLEVRRTVNRLAELCGPDRVHHRVCDVLDADRTKAVLDEVMDRHGRIDLLVNTVLDLRSRALHAKTLVDFRAVTGHQSHRLPQPQTRPGRPTAPDLVQLQHPGHPRPRPRRRRLLRRQRIPGVRERLGRPARTRGTPRTRRPLERLAGSRRRQQRRHAGNPAPQPDGRLHQQPAGRRPVPRRGDPAAGNGAASSSSGRRNAYCWPGGESAPTPRVRAADRSPDAPHPTPPDPSLATPLLDGVLCAGRRLGGVHQDLGSTHPRGAGRPVDAPPPGQRGVRPPGHVHPRGRRRRGRPPLPRTCGSPVPRPGLPDVGHGVRSAGPTRTVAVEARVASRRPTAPRWRSGSTAPTGSARTARYCASTTCSARRRRAGGPYPGAARDHRLLGATPPRARLRHAGVLRRSADPAQRPVRGTASTPEGRTATAPGSAWTTRPGTGPGRDDRTGDPAGRDGAPVAPAATRRPSTPGRPDGRRSRATLGVGRATTAGSARAPVIRLRRRFADGTDRARPVTGTSWPVSPGSAPMPPDHSESFAPRRRATTEPP